MSTWTNMPEIKMGLVGVSRDCFPIELTRRRLAAVATACQERNLPVVVCETLVESERDALTAAQELRAQQVNALTVYLGNFGPEGPATILAREMQLPFMLAGAAEESARDLIHGRGDAFCGLLNACLNAGLRDLTPYVPARPVGLPEEVAGMIGRFIQVARVVYGIRQLKVFSFGPRPHDFYACNAPIKPLYSLGVEIMENSELDLLEQYRAAADNTNAMASVAGEMEKELGAGNRHPEKLRQLAQFEVALTTFFERNLGSRQFGVFANKCWPAFEPVFGFVPCYVNSRLAARGIPAACEVDIYGAVSEYLLQLASDQPVTLLDVNNTVPDDLAIADLRGVSREDLFMGFHCGNTPSCCLCEGCSMKYQRIMNRLMEAPDAPPDITCGTLEGALKPGPVTVLRLQATPECSGLMSYLAQGHILDADPASFGSIGIFAIPDFARFYRHVMLERQFPHHAAVAFRHIGSIVVDALHLLGVEDRATPKPAAELYPTENPFGLD